MLRLFIGILTREVPVLNNYYQVQFSIWVLKPVKAPYMGNLKKNTEGFVNMEWKGPLTVEQDIRIITQLCPHLEKVIVVWFARMWSCESLRHR